MGYQQCVQAIKDAAEGALSDDEVADMVESVIARRDAVRQGDLGLSAAEATAQAAKELSDEEKMAAAIEKRNALLNLQARQARRAGYQDMVDAISARGEGRVAGALGDAIQARVRGIETNVEGARLSANVSYKAFKEQLLAGMTKELDDAGLFRAARSGALDRETAREMFELSKGADGQPGVSNSKQALEIAKVFNRYQTLAKDSLNRFGAWIGDYSGYIAHTSHDADLIRRGGLSPLAARGVSEEVRRATWKADILKGLDDKTFEGVEDRDKFLNGVWNAFVTGVHMKADNMQGMKDPAFTGAANLAAKASTERVLHFRDADAWMDYMDNYGRGTLAEKVSGNLDGAARQAGLMQHFGTNPSAELDADIQWMKEEYRDSNVEGVRNLRGRERNIRNEFGHLDGSANVPANELAAKIGSGVRAVESLAKLPLVALTHLSTLGTSAGTLMRNGVPFLEAWGNRMRSLMPTLEGTDRGNVYDELLAGMEGRQHDLVSRFSMDDTTPGTLNRIANFTFKWNGLTFLVNNSKAGVEYALSRRLGRQLDRGFENLEPKTRSQLAAYGISPAEWDILRQAPDHVAIDGRQFLTPKAMERVDDGTIREHLRGQNALPGQVPQGVLEPAEQAELEAANEQRASSAVQGFRETLALKLHAYLLDQAEHAVVTPGLPERALFLQGTAPGSYGGEILRYISQFKAWPAAAIRQQMGAEFYGRQDIAGAIWGASHMIAASMALGYAAMTLKDLVKGRDPRRPGADTAIAALMQGGGLGIFGDYLFGQFDRMGHNFAETAAGPVLGEGIGTALDLWNRIKGNAIADIDGDTSKRKDIAPELLRTAINNAPIVNMFPLRMALDHLIFYQLQEQMSPGYLLRYEHTVEKQNHQTFWLRPSSALQH